MCLSFFFVSCSEKQASSDQQVKTQFDNKSFLKSLQSNDLVKGLKQINDFFLDRSIGNVPAVYLNLAKSEGVKADYLEDKKFNELDFMFWRQGAYLKFIAEKSLASNLGKDPVQVLTDLIYNEVKVPGEKKDFQCFPVDVWNRKYGYCDRQSWLLSEILYQVGIESSVIYLYDDQHVSPHTICEARFKGVSYLLDPMFGKSLKNVSLETITEKQIVSTWKDQPNFHNAFENAVYLIPSLPVDYTQRHKLLTSVKAHLPFRIAEDPQVRIKKWTSKSKKVQLWPIPFRVLADFRDYQNLYK